MKEYKVDGHVSSFLPDNYNWKLVWNDEFDGTELDTSKWDFRFHMMHKRHKSWGDEGIRFDGNSNIIFFPYEKDGEICSTQLQTGANFMDAPLESDTNDVVNEFVWPIGKLKKPKFLHKYGYYECRCRLQKKPGWWSAFWLQSPIQGATLDPEFSGTEVDIMESFTPGKVIQHMVHYNGCGPDYDNAPVGSGAELKLDGFHTFGFLWTKDSYTFYIDGKQDGTLKKPISQTPQFILLSTEMNGYRNPEPAPTDEAKNALGDEFVVDYVRVFDVEE